MLIYGFSVSPFVRKVMMLANEKGIDFTLVPYTVGNPEPEFCAASPMRKMPAMDDDGYCLADSSAICHYLDAKVPDPALIPAEAKARGQAIWFDEFADTVLVGCGVKIFFNRIVAPYLLRRPNDLAAADAAEADELPPILDYLEQVVPDAGGYLVGDKVTLADISVASPFVNLRHAGVKFDGARHGRTLAWVDSVLARPSVASIVAEEEAFLAKVMAA